MSPVYLKVIASTAKANVLWSQVSIFCLLSSILRAIKQSLDAGKMGINPEDPADLAQEPTDAGIVHNLKWRFSDSSTRRLQGGWVREQVITDLPASNDISGAQQHLAKGSIREPH